MMIKTLNDWHADGKYDASHTADRCNILPYTPLDIAVWSSYHKVPSEVLVGLLVRHPVNTTSFEDWHDMEQVPTLEEYERWLAGYCYVAAVICIEMVHSFEDQVSCMSEDECMMYCVRIKDRFPSLPAVWHEPTVDDIPVLV